MVEGTCAIKMFFEHDQQKKKKKVTTEHLEFRNSINFVFLTTTPGIGNTLFTSL